MAKQNGTTQQSPVYLIFLKRVIEAPVFNVDAGYASGHRSHRDENGAPSRRVCRKLARHSRKHAIDLAGRGKATREEWIGIRGERGRVQGVQSRLLTAGQGDGALVRVDCEQSALVPNVCLRNEADFGAQLWHIPAHLTDSSLLTTSDDNNELI